MKHLEFKDLQIIHLFNDDKFVDPTVDLFETEIPKQSKYFVLKQIKEPLKYVISKQVEVVFLDNLIAIEHFNETLRSTYYNAIFIHALNDIKVQFLDTISNNIVKVWFSWGFDLYPKLKNYNKIFFEKETKRFLQKNRRKISIKQRLLQSDLSEKVYLGWKEGKYTLPAKLKNVLVNTHKYSFAHALKNIDVFVPVIQEEIEVLREFNISFKNAPYTYGCLEYYLTNLQKENVLSTNNILIGNSADPTNNHVDVFKKIANFNYGNRLIYVPLNYGGNKAYIDFVVEQGNSYFKENFKPILNFLPLKEYNNIVSSCGFLMFNHVRQQGVANIISLGYLGAKLFLNKRSPVYKYYKDLGIDVNAIQDIAEVQLNSNLTINGFKNNQKLFSDIYSKKAVLEKVNKLLGVVSKEVAKNER